MSHQDRITPIERDNIVTMLRTVPLPEVLRRSGRSIKTLMRIAEVAL